MAGQKSLMDKPLKAPRPTAKSRHTEKGSPPSPGGLPVKIMKGSSEKEAKGKARKAGKKSLTQGGSGPYIKTRCATPRWQRRFISALRRRRTSTPRSQ